MSGSWSHDWQGDILLVKNSGLFTHEESVDSSAAMLRALGNAPGRFAIVCDLTDFPPQPAENDDATRPVTEAFADLMAAGRLAGVAMVNRRTVTKLQTNRWAREANMPAPRREFEDVASAVVAMRKLLTSTKV
jgi:hypothetical protein